MGTYKIEQKITTIASNAVMQDISQPASFVCDNVFFTHGNFSFQNGWLSDYWYASIEIVATNRLEAYNTFIDKLRKIIPKISLISQCYISFHAEPFLITRLDSYTDVALFKLVRDRPHVGLMFMEEHKVALDTLINNSDAPEEFYLYWNDAVNTTGYSSKLLLMFCAIEALSKHPTGKKDWDKVESILGKELKDEIFEPNVGLRHRLVHGEYFSGEDSGKDYLDIIHKAVIRYFNDKIIKKHIIDEEVVHPQRNFLGNKEEGGPWFITYKEKQKDANFSLKDVITNKTGLEELNLESFQIISRELSKDMNKEF